jgi:hypothetical protein
MLGVPRPCMKMKTSRTLRRQALVIPVCADASSRPNRLRRAVTLGALSTAIAPLRAQGTAAINRALPRPFSLPIPVVRGHGGRVLQAERGRLFPEDVEQLARWLV